MSKQDKNQHLPPPQIRFKQDDGSDFPDWQERRLGEIGETFSGLSGKTKDDFGKGKPFIQYMQIFSSAIINTSNFGLVRIRNGEKQTKVRLGDIFFTTSSETAEEIGYSSVLIENVEEVYLNSFCFGYRPYSLSQLYPNFSAYLFRSELFRKKIIKLAQGSTRYNMSKVQLMNIHVSLPVLEEQQKIGSFLQSVDTKIQLLERKVTLLQSYKKGVMQKLFSQELRFKDEQGNEYPDWQERRLGELCKIAKSGGTPKSTNSEYYDGNIPFLAISDMTSQGKYLTYTSKNISQKGMDNSASWLVPVNTIIYSMYASVGFISINKIPIATSQAVINLILRDTIDIEYMYYYLLNLRYRQYIRKLTQTGTQSNLDAQIVKSLKILLPTLPEQQKIASFLQSLDTKISLTQKQVALTKQYKKGLLQRMFV